MKLIDLLECLLFLWSGKQQVQINWQKMNLLIKPSLSIPKIRIRIYNWLNVHEENRLINLVSFWAKNKVSSFSTLGVEFYIYCAVKNYCHFLVHGFALSAQLQSWLIMCIIQKIQLYMYVQDKGRGVTDLWDTYVRTTVQDKRRGVTDLWEFPITTCFYGRAKLP